MDVSELDFFQIFEILDISYGSEQQKRVQDFLPRSAQHLTGQQAKGIYLTYDYYSIEQESNSIFIIL